GRRGTGCGTAGPAHPGPARAAERLSPGPGRPAGARPRARHGNGPPPCGEGPLRPWGPSRVPRSLLRVAVDLARGAGVVGAVRLTGRALLQPLLPGELPVAPPVVPLDLAVGVLHDQRVAHVGVLVEPLGVLG